MTKDAILAAAKRMLDRGEPREKVKAFVQRARERMETNAKDTRDAGQMSGLGKAATFVERGVNSASFGLGGLAGDALAALDSDKPYRESFKDVRAERSNRNQQLGGAGYAADVIGGLLTGKAAFSALKAVPKIAAKAKPWMLAGAEAGTQAGVTGAAEGLDDLSLEGLAKSAKTGAVTAAGGAVLGAAAGKAAGGAAKWWKGRNITKELVAKGVNIKEAQALAKQLPDLDEAAAREAIGRIDEFVAMGKGGEVMAADVIPQARRTLRAATNLSKEGDELATTRLRERDANVGTRARNDLADVSKFSPQEAALGVEDMAKARAEKAEPLYELFRGQGELPVTPDLQALSDLGVFKTALATVQNESPSLSKLPWNDARVLDAVYKRIGNKAFKATNAFETNEARTSLLKAMDDASGGLYSPAVKEFADESSAIDAYKTGQELLAKSGGDLRATMRKTAEPNQDFVRRGVMDAAHARVSAKAPNPDLGAAGKASSGVGQEAVGDMDAREVMREVLGEKGYARLVDRAKAEAQMAATSKAAQGSSATPKQQADLGSALNLITTLGESLSVNPAWMLTMFGRREMGQGFGKIMQKVAASDAKTVADALSRMGSKEAKTVLDGLIEEISRRQMAQATGKSVARRTRNAVARAAAPND